MRRVAMTERERRDACLWYDANFDPELLAERMRADELCHRLNQLAPSSAGERDALLRELLSEVGEGVTILGPLHVDYGYNVRVGAASFVNHGAYLMDCAPITIGERVFVGPGCGMYTAEHPLLPGERASGLERALPITVCDDVWIGGDVTILPGVTIGAGSVVGAHSTVTCDVPPGVVAVGSPCRVLRAITAEDTVLDDASGPQAGGAGAARAGDPSRAV